MKNKRKSNSLKISLGLIVIVIVAIFAYFGIDISYIEDIFGTECKISYATSFALDSIPEFNENTPYVVLNDNMPEFTEEDLSRRKFEEYSELDYLRRCGVAFAKIGLETMPTEKRGDIASVKPSGWKNEKYDFIDGSYLYNRCHLIGYQLAAENANEKNLITGTRFMNTQGMLPFENMVAEYVKKTKKHVLYRITPIFEGDNLVVSGVQMEAFSVEDNGKGVCFNVYVYNNQPGVLIDYSTGESLKI